MAKQAKLSARIRSESGRNAVKQVRARGGVPAVIYGSKDKATNLEVSQRDIQALLTHAVGENILIDLEIDEDGKKTNRLSLIQAVQRHPLHSNIVHVDFHAVSMTEEISADIVIEAFGESEGVKSFGGLLEQGLRTLAIRCLPQNLPEIIRVDVSPLKIGDSIHVRDLPLPDGVTPVDDIDLTVFIVAEPKVAEEPVVAAASESPEVIKEKKPEAGAPGEKK